MTSRALFALSSFLFLLLLNEASLASGSQGYGDEGYEQPPPTKNTKFNIGFNLPAMSISLPKLELPQISIKASMKNKKPFVLQLPIIKFNAHASSEEEDAYPTGNNEGYGNNGGGKNYGNNEGNSYGNQGGQSYGGPGMAYATAGNGVSAYVSSSDSGPSYSGGPNVGYERPAAGQYQDVGQVEPAYAGSGYVPAPAQYASPPQEYPSNNQNKNYQQGPPQQYHHHQQPQQYSNINQYINSNQALPTYQEFKAPAASSPYQATQPTVAANGYYVPRPVIVGQYNPNNNHANNNNNIQYLTDDNKHYAPMYTQQQPPVMFAQSVPAADHAYLANFHGNNNLNFNPQSRYGRRSGRTHVEKIGGVFLAASSDRRGSYILAPWTEDAFSWKPIIRQ